MSRTLRYNPRRLQEPFVYCEIRIDSTSGVPTPVLIRKIVLFGDIRHKDSPIENAYQETSNKQLSIKIARNFFPFKPLDRILYRDQQYIINTIDYDSYSRGELIITCDLEGDIKYSDELYDGALEAALYG